MNQSYKLFTSTSFSLLHFLNLSYSFLKNNDTYHFTVINMKEQCGFGFFRSKHPQQMCQMCQMPNIWHIWHTKHKNKALSNVLNVLNFCNVLQYHCIFDKVRTQMAFVLYYYFYSSFSLIPLYATLSPLLWILLSFLPLCLIALSLMKDGFRCEYILAWAPAWVR